MPLEIRQTMMPPYAVVSSGRPQFRRMARPALEPVLVEPVNGQRDFPVGGQLVSLLADS